MNSNPLFELKREGVSEIAVYGELSVSKSTRNQWRSNEVRTAFPARSLLKPFQVLATGIFEAREKNPWWHVALGSISCKEEQIAKLKQWIEDPELKSLVSKLQIPPSYPMDERYRTLLKEEGKKPEVIFHTCFSKHLAILDACKRYQWPESNYLTDVHPFHKELEKTLNSFLKPHRKAFQFVKDGCGLPSPVLFLDEMAELFRVLALGSSSQLKIIRDQMMAEPFWVGGSGRIDTQLMELNPGKLIAKEGADGLLGIGILPNPLLPEGLGVVVKISAGYLPHWACLSLTPILESYGLKVPSKIPSGQTIHYRYQYDKEVQSQIFDLSPLISEKLAVWPGDISFSRDVSLQTLSGDHLTLSSIRSTVHLGTHTDAPIHFKDEPVGIDQVPLEKYFGPCQVIEVRKAPGEAITEADLLNHEILAPRVLLKTGSYPDPEVFHETFNSIASDVIRYLAEKKVILVGIDTPSIDPFDSKDLPAHQETGKAEMAILEGVDLKNISEGVYQLVTLPLKIKGSDASPVRAILVK